ncbi:MAG: hypothetical protein IJ275_00960 [Ruminococcus sp.]|nr:hypothetical protein [Ruminococcus sp.]
MLTSLDIITPTYKSKLKKLFSKLMFDTMRVDIVEAGDIKLKMIEYINRSGKVNWNKIDKEVLAQRNRILCNKNLWLPKNHGYKRFCDYELKKRLCTNLAISLLCQLEENRLSVGLLDLDASYTSLPKYLLKYTDSVVVVTEETDIYTHVVEELLDETGAPIRLSKSIRSLEGCDLVIAVNGIVDELILKENAVLLTTKKPEKNYDATVVYDYRIELSEELESICPKSLSHTYFACALYTMCHMYKLGSQIPLICVSHNMVHTPSSLKVLIQNKTDKTLT